MRLFSLFIFVCLSGFNGFTQVNCNQMFLQDVVLDPTNSEAVLVDFLNPSFQTIALPGFRAYNEFSEEYLGSETVAYVFLPGESTHRVFIGNTLDLESPQALIFELWEQEYDSLLCGFSWQGNLSNHPDCFQSQINTSSASSTASEDVIQIEITDYETNEVIVSEIINLASQNFNPFAEICLEEGCYSITGTMSSPATYDYSVNLFIETYIDYFLLDIQAGFSEFSNLFQIWSGCPVGINEPVQANASLYPNSSTDGYFKLSTTVPISTLKIYTLDGKLVQEVSSVHQLERLISNGVYVVHIQFENGVHEAKRLIVQQP